jgi:hypothetical protein
MRHATAGGAFAVLLSALAASVGALGTERRSGAIDRHLPAPVDPAMQTSVVTVKRGHGPAAREGDVVELRYDGRSPKKVTVGWGDGVAGMRIGERRRVVLRETLAAGEPLSHEVELVAIGGENHDE